MQWPLSFSLPDFPYRGLRLTHDAQCTGELAPTILETPPSRPRHRTCPLTVYSACAVGLDGVGDTLD